MAAATLNQLTAVHFEQATLLLEAIASAALQLNTFCTSGWHEAADENTVQLHVGVMSTLVSQIGWMADLGHKKLTSQETVKGDAEHWMVHPLYERTLREKA